MYSKDQVSLNLRFVLTFFLSVRAESLPGIGVVTAVVTGGR